LIIERREGESGERLLSRFRQLTQQSGILREVKRRRHFISKSEARRVAQAKAMRRARRNAEKSFQKDNNGRRRT
jgi:small subunit ribosomal protein S21